MECKKVCDHWVHNKPEGNEIATLSYTGIIFIATANHSAKQLLSSGNNDMWSTTETLENNCPFWLVSTKLYHV